MIQADAPLVRACLAGDRRAWETLIRRYERLIYSVPVRCGLSADDAADVFQTVCIRLLDHLEKLRDEEHVARWLIITAKHESWRVHRQRQRCAVFSERTDPETGTDPLDAVAADGLLPEQEAVRLEEEQLVRLALGELGDRCQRLLELLYLTDPPLSYVEVAGELNMTWTSVSATRIRCLQKLKRVLDRLGF
jgi:RNA polymerase sigma factor (sigma-70 family)